MLIYRRLIDTPFPAPFQRDQLEHICTTTTSASLPNSARSTSPASSMNTLAQSAEFMTSPENLTFTADDAALDPASLPIDFQYRRTINSIPPLAYSQQTKSTGDEATPFMPFAPH